MAVPREHRPEYRLGLRYIAESIDGLTAVELAGLLGIDKRNVLKYLAAWAAEEKVFIIKYERSLIVGGPMKARWAIRTSPGQKDARPPKPLTDAQKQKNYRKRHADRIEQRRKAQWIVKKASNRGPASAFPE